MSIARVSHRPPSRARSLTVRAIAAGILLFAAGVAELAAVWLRWAPCLAEPGLVTGGTVSAGGLCLQYQQHVYDFAPPIDPFIAIPHAVELVGLATLLIGIAALLWVPVFSRANHRRVVLSLPALVAIGQGIASITAGITDGAAGVLPAILGPPLALVQIILFAIAATMLLTSAPLRPVRIPMAVLLAGTVLSSAVVEYITLEMLIGSPGTPPGTGFAHAVVLLVSGALFVVTALRSREPQPRR